MILYFYIVISTLYQFVNTSFNCKYIAPQCVTVPPTVPPTASPTVPPTASPTASTTDNSWFMTGTNKNFVPQQIKIALDNKADTVLLTWTTIEKTTEYNCLIGDENQWHKRYFANDSKTYSTNKYTSPWIHRLKIDNLLHGKKYYYQCGHQSKSDLNYCSKRTFETATTTNTPFKFAIVGDIDRNQDSEETINNIAKNKQIKFLSIPGDLSYADEDEMKWDDFGTLFDYHSSEIFWMTGVGNHEANEKFISFQQRYFMPYESSNALEGNLYFSYNYDNVHIIMLSSETSFTESSQQFQWFMNHMKKINRLKQPWLFVFFHRPPYHSNQKHSTSGKKFIDIYEPHFIEYKVDIVFNGHVHAYERTFAMKQNSKNDCYQNIYSICPIYMTIGTGGRRLYKSWNKQPIWSEERIATFGYGTIEILNESVALHEFIFNDGTIIKSDITKLYPRIW